MSIEKIEKDGGLLAIIVHNTYDTEGTNFISDESHSFQVGFHKRKKGYRYRSHITNPFAKLENLNPSKIYYVTKGKIGIDFYNQKKEKVDYKTLSQGDLIIFISGGHGVDVLEDGSFIEIKQGPYRGTKEDKTFLE